MGVRIISDSSCDLTLSEAKEKGIGLVSLKTMIDGVEYLDGLTITGEEFYEKLDHCKSLPTTSQVPPDEFSQQFKAAVDNGDDVLAITIASELSGTAQSAHIAAADYPGRVWVVDSGSATAGQRILLEYAIQLRDAGRTAAEIAAELEAKKEKVCLVALVDTLEYLMRGGRLSKAAAIAGTVLNIKPVLSVECGKIKVLGKARGSKQSNNMLSEMIEKKGGIDFSMPLMLAYSGTDDALLQGYIYNSRALWEGNISSLPVSVLGSTIGTHAGPGAIAVAFFAKT